jgi:DNA-binding TFAR19-related protein (PDSD5 family)
VVKLVDMELERLKRRKMLEIQRKLLMEKKETVEKKPMPKEPSNREILDKYFYGRAWEIYNAAYAQFPKIMPQVEKALVEALRSGKVNERIDGENLYNFLRQIGLRVRLHTTIKYKEHGELKSISQRIKEKE